MKSKLQFMWLFFFVMIVGGSIKTTKGHDDFAKKCSEVVQKVLPCLEFATGKEQTPKTECCDSAKKIKDTEPECLCYIIQQTHNGGDQFKSLNIQEDKLLQLPSACKVNNASISDCPKLLGLAPSSPDAAIFTNSSKVNPPASSNSTSNPESQNGSFGTMLRPPMVSEVMMVVLAIALIALPISIYT